MLIRTVFLLYLYITLKYYIMEKILYENNNYYVSNEGSKKEPSYHVWIPSITHSVCDSAYLDLELAICRCNYLAKNNTKIK